MTRTQIQLEDAQAAKLRVLSEREGSSVAEVVRRAVAGLLSREAMPRELVRRRALEAIGRFGSGTRDTSSGHDEHLADAFAR